MTFLHFDRFCTWFLKPNISASGVLYGSPEVTAGGNALKFYSSIRLDTRRKEILPDNTGIRIKVKVVKNKIAPPFATVNLDILFGTGIDTMGCLVDAAVELDVIQRRGSWYAYQGNNVAQGRTNVIQILKDDATLASNVEQNIRQALSNVPLDRILQTNTTEEEEEDDDDDENAGGSIVGEPTRSTGISDAFRMMLEE
jgi:recombination protein RecA